MASRIDNDDDEGGGGFALGDLIGLMRRRWLVIAGCTMALGLVAAVVAYSLPSRYEAAATVQIDPRKKTIVNLENVISDLKADQSTVESEVEVLHSKTILLKVIDALELRSHPDFTRPTLIQSLLRRVGLANDIVVPAERPRPTLEGVVLANNDQPGGLAPERDELVSAFEKRLKVGRVRNTLLIEVKFSAGEPVLAARVANTLLEVYLKEQLAAKVKATGQATELLEQKLEGLRQKVYDAERRVAAFKAEHNIFDAEGQLLSEKQLARLMEQTVIARNHTAETKARYEQVHEMLKKGQHRNSIADVLQSPTIRLFKDQLVKATRREAELLTKYGPKHPEMVRARAEVADIEMQLAVEVDKIVSNLETEFRVAAERERALAQSLGGLKDQQVISKDAAVLLKELEREALTSKQVFEAFLSRYKQTAETADLQVADSRIVERADVPLNVASPKRMQLTGLGVLAGLACGFGLALLLEFASPGLRRPEDIEEALGIAHLASVPLLKRRSDGFDTPDTAIRAAIVVPDGVFAESLRTARHSIDIRRHDPNPRVILITSALPNEGKTLLAANLAYQLATQGVRTLLIDADVRRSSLSQQLGLDRAPGLLDAIARGHPFEGYLMRDATTGLVVLGAGGGGQIAPSMSPVQALDAPGFGQRIARLKTHFDTIIIDAAPLLPVVDARILADHADQIVLVTTWGKTPRQLIRRAIHLLGANGGKLAGAVINQVDVIEHARSFGYGQNVKRDRSAAQPRKAA
ncbi:MAG: GumC family protein [Hyphomicrobiaceae bacterium]